MKHEFIVTKGGGDSIVLPPIQPGDEVTFKNMSAEPVSVFPATEEKIKLGVSAAFLALVGALWRLARRGVS